MRSVVQDYLDSIMGDCSADRSGAVADYIPELAAADPDRFGICVASADGFVYEAGDSRVPFTIQSISKPFTYGLALADRGLDAVDAKVGVEPSGDAFNEISLDPESGRPRNPMINAGAITAASLVDGTDDADTFERVRRAYSQWAGRELALDEQVYASELRTGHRNRAIGHMLRTVAILEDDPEPVVDRYFRQCSLLVDARDLALMAATLANNGIQPLTGEQVLAPHLVERVLSVMTTCGMYDGAGDWVSGVGMPAKSGVGGGVLAVLPGQIGVAVFSPRLDEHGNSVRGVEACRRLSRELELHFLHVSRGARSAVRASWDLVDRPSRRRRTPEEEEVLREHGRRARIYALHGDLRFAGAETVVREIARRSDDLELLVLDLRRVDEVASVARRMLGELRSRLRESGCEVSIVDPDGVLPEPEHDDQSWPPRHGGLDGAVEWCEDELLARHGTASCRLERVALEDHPLVARLDAAQLEVLRAHLRPRTASAGDVLARRGDPPVGIHLVLSGRVTVSVDGPDGRPRRVATLSAGMSFGELALVAGQPHAADVHADGHVDLLVLDPDAFAALGTEDPAVRLGVVEGVIARIFETDDRAAAAIALRRVAGAAPQHGGDAPVPAPA
ncbi:glutaminase A [Patulibacter minatonensis]|uniref:glutaminase A n=1 Tax=Patulibacter minatonensis TaxID=298163 RepID=UPI001B7FA7AF|nr:glutaminase A [Patulibacter minatonensis]